MSIDTIKVIIIDIDGTLTDEISWIKLTQCLGANAQEHLRIFNEFKEHKLSYTDAKRMLITLWQDTGKSTKSELKKIFSSWNLKNDAQEIIEYLKKKYTVILISGSVDTYVEVVAKKLGIVIWYANTKLIWNKQGQLIDFDYHRDQAKKKVEQLEEFLKTNHYTKDQCLVIGDGDSDLELFRILPFSIAVINENYLELEQLAWKNVSSLQQIKEIL